jgi:DNA repair exonuclease SbcCD ATPase subunit
MSDDLSKQSHAKFEALVPVVPNQTRAAEKTERSAAHSPTKPSHTETSYSALRKEVVELGSRLDAFILDNAEHLKKEGETQANVEKIASEMSDLSNRMPKVEELTAEIRTLKNEVLFAEEELRKLTTNLDEQNLKLRQLDASSTRMNVALDSVIPTVRAQPINEGGNSYSSSAQVAVTYTRRCIYCGCFLERVDRFCNRCGHRAV